MNSPHKRQFVLEYKLGKLEGIYAQEHLALMIVTLKKIIEDRLSISRANVFRHQYVLQPFVGMEIRYLILYMLFLPFSFYLSKTESRFLILWVSKNRRSPPTSIFVLVIQEIDPNTL